MEQKQHIQELLSRSIEAIYPSKDAVEKALQEKKLTVYLGVDPTGPHMHLGHATNLLVLRRLQELGHTIIFLIGDFTARIGDPTDKLATRKPLTEQQIKHNFKTFKKQASKVLKFSGPNAVQVKYNSTWFKKMRFDDIIKLAQHVTVSQMIGRDMFQKRIAEDKPIGLHEFLYPLMQGYDSVAMNVDMEVGGNDQTFNMLMGRDLVKVYHQKEKFVLATTLLINPETGTKLMNKSEGGMINLDDTPEDMFGGVMALHDQGMIPVATHCTVMPMKRVHELEKKLLDASVNPRDIKLEIAHEVVSLYHSPEAADKAQQQFINTFSKGEVPENIPELSVSSPILLVDLLIKAGVESKSQARRLIEQKAIKINETPHTNTEKEIELHSGDILKIGKRQFFRIS